MLPRHHNHWVLGPRHVRELGVAHDNDGLPLLLNTSLLMDLNQLDCIDPRPEQVTKRQPSPIRPRLVFIAIDGAIFRDEITPFSLFGP